MTRQATSINSPRLAVIVSMLSGLESFVKREVEGLVDRGYSVRLFATKHNHSPGFEPRPDIPFLIPSPAAVVSGTMIWFVQKPLLVISLMAEAIRLKGLTECLLAISWAKTVLADNTDLIHCAFGDRKYFIGYFLHRLTGIPLTVAIHAHEIYAQPNPSLFRQALTHTSGIVTISEKNRRLLCESYGLSESEIDVIRLSIDLDFWNFENRQINVLTVARFTPRKGWNELIEAAKLLGSSFHFYGVGFGELDIEALAQNAGVGHQFTLFPKLRPQHIRLLMQACDIFCLPSKPTEDEGSEGVPVVLMEAMAMGMAIVTTDDGSISELVDHEIVRPGDAKALADAILRTAERVDPVPRSLNIDGRKRVVALHGEKNFDRLDIFFKSKIRQR